MVRRGAFREDLFYRLNVVTVWLPPLRARRADIAPLVEHYLRLFREQTGRPQLAIAPDALRALEAERWPGNVRQLVNFIERLVVLAQADVISAGDVSRELGEQLEFLTQAAVLDSRAGAAVGVSPAVTAAEPPVAASTAEPSPPSPGAQELLSAVRPLREDLRRAELRSITKALHSAKGNRALAARLLGISRRTLYTKLEEHGIE
jgi:two-component system response regulator AtoC